MTPKGTCGLEPVTKRKVVLLVVCCYYAVSILWRYELQWNNYSHITGYMHVHKQLHVTWNVTRLYAVICLYTTPGAVLHRLLWISSPHSSSPPPDSSLTAESHSEQSSGSNCHKKKTVYLVGNSSPNEYTPPRGAGWTKCCRTRCR